MKVKDIANQYGFDSTKFENWLMNISGVPLKSGILGGFLIDDDRVEGAVASYQAHKAASEQEAERQKRLAEQAAVEKQQAMASMLITSGFSFDGYRITKYSGYISGDDVVQVDRGSERWFGKATNVGDSLMSSLSTIRRNALAELKEAAYNLGCNAVVGVDFDYLNLEPETVNANGGTLYLPYVFGVTANGNAVIIEKE